MASKLSTYDVVYNGQRTRMRLSEADAKRLGATPVKGSGTSTTTKTAKKTSSKKRSAPQPADAESGDSGDS